MEVSGRVHSTDLKERLLANVPGLQADRKGRDIFLACNDEVQRRPCSPQRPLKSYSSTKTDLEPTKSAF